MPEENVEVVRRAFAFGMQGHGDPAEALTDFDPDVVLNSFEEPASRGRDAVRGNYERWRSAWEDVEATAEEFIDAGNRVIVTAHFRGRGRGSGAEVEARFYEVYTLRDSKVVRVDEFTDRSEALEAAGLRDG
jgi:2-(1,2-epoxy-1,2-dihydrophenyl)acetyl-CoA isomerase